MPDAIWQGLGGLAIATLSFFGTRLIGRDSRRATDATWSARYRAGAERHLEWDGDRRADIYQLRALLNDVQRTVGIEPTQFEEIPPAPSLFPDPEPTKEK